MSKIEGACSSRNINQLIILTDVVENNWKLRNAYGDIIVTVPRSAETILFRNTYLEFTLYSSYYDNPGKLSVSDITLLI